MVGSNKCGHQDRPLWAKEKCHQCYDADYRIKHKTNIAVRKSVYDIKHKNELKAKRTIRYSSPETKARKYIYETNCKYNNVILWFRIPPNNRICHFCGGPDANDLDHDHDTKEIRGWAHKMCNAAEGTIGKSYDPVKFVLSLSKIHEYDKEGKESYCGWGPRCL